jgi:hypothetical protein
MPDWCSNKIIIDLSESRDCDFARKIVLLKMGVPITDDEMPDGFFSYLCNSKAGNRTISDNCNEWGTKWDVRQPQLTDENDDYCSDVMFTDSEGRYIWLIDTAWSPPIGFIEKLSALNPGAIIDLLYCEQGADYIGYITMENSEVLRRQEETLTDIAGHYPEEKDFLNDIEAFEDACDNHYDTIEERIFDYFDGLGFDGALMHAGG